MASGVNVTLSEQLAAGARLTPQLDDSAKSEGFAPVILIPVIERSALPELVRATDCATLVFPRDWVPNATLPGEIVPVADWTRTDTVFATELVVAKSGRPSLLKSAVATPIGLVPEENTALSEMSNVPSPLPGNIDTVLSPKFATARERLPVPRKSPATRAKG